MAGLSRSKNGVLKDAYVPAIHAFLHKKTWMPGIKPGMTAVSAGPTVD
jgi:hypothetical protein